MIIFGGSFNPPHLGHLNIIKYFIEHYLCDKIYIIPNYQSPFKEERQVFSYHILKMIQLNFDFSDKIKILNLEIEKQKSSYTFETLQELIKLYPNDNYNLLIGEDNYIDFHRWYKFETILNQIKKLYVFRRFGKEIEENFHLVNFNEKIIKLKNSIFQGDSTEIRKSLLISKKSYFLKKSVLNYILEHRLYEA